MCRRDRGWATLPLRARRVLAVLAHPEKLREAEEHRGGECDERRGGPQRGVLVLPRVS